MMFILLAATILLLNNGTKPTRPCKWFIIALILVGMVRLNQAVYFWFQIESGLQATIIGTAILRPLMLGSWLMAWWEWFNLQKPKWLPKIIALLALLYMATQLPGVCWPSNAMVHTHYTAIVGYLRLLLLALILFIACQGIRKQGARSLLVLVALLLLIVALFPSEISELNLIPGIWYPYGVGVSRGQFFYAAFVLVMYVVLIRVNRKVTSQPG